MMAGKYQMDNKQIAAVLDNLAKLMEIHGENSFRAKAYATAAFRVSKLPYQLSEKSLDELTKEPGIGNSMANKIFGLLQDGRIPELEVLKSKTPEGILQMLNVKGLGPK